MARLLVTITASAARRSPQKTGPKWSYYFPTCNCARPSSTHMDKSSTSQNRRSRRSNLWMAASLESDGVTVPVTLRNLSAEGALVDGDHGLSVGAEIVFHKNDLSVAGHVAWVDGRRAGLAFVVSLDPETVLRYVPVPAPLRIEVHKRPALRGRLSTEDRLAAERLYGRPMPSPGK